METQQQEPALPGGLDLVHVEHADSARAEAVRRALAGAEEGTVVRVDRPGEPLGRAGHRWLLASDPGLHAALVLRPGLPASDCAQLGPLTAVAIARAIAPLVEPMTELHYRWPNDVLLDRGKVAGVWLDGGGTAARLDWLVASLAVNTRLAPEALGFDAATIAADGAAGEVDAGELLRAIVRELVSAIATWDEAGFEPLLRSWRGRLTLGGPIHIDSADSGHIAGTAETLHDDGSLSVRTDAGEHRVSLERFFDLPGEDRA